MNPQRETNWDAYYSKEVKLASISRAWTIFYLQRLLSKFISKDQTNFIELGGGDSCCISSLLKKFSPKSYLVIDKNNLGLEKLKKRYPNDPHINTRQVDLLGSSFKASADIVLSLGLIEHFNKKGTASLIKTHFDSVKKGGLVLITFPTPTFLYKIARRLSELFGLWIFHDERPLSTQEVDFIAQQFGQKLHSSINWPIIFTQAVVIYKKL